MIYARQSTTSHTAPTENKSYLLLEINPFQRQRIRDDRQRHKVVVRQQLRGGKRAERVEQ